MKNLQYLPLLGLLLTSVAIAYGDTLTATVINHTECICSTDNSGIGHCQQTAGAGVAVYTFNANQGVPILPAYSTINVNSSGQAPVVQSLFDRINTIDISNFANGGAWSSSAKPVSPNDTLYAIQMITFAGQLVGVATFSNCPAVMPPTLAKFLNR